MSRRFTLGTVTGFAVAALAAALTIGAPPAFSIHADTARPPTNHTGAPYWHDWDIARGVMLQHVNSGGYVVNAWGGLHPFGGAPALMPRPPYGPGLAYVQGGALQGDDLGGVVIDARGTVFSFGTLTGGPVNVCDQSPRVGVPIRGIALDPTPTSGPTSYDTKGATLDAWGGIHLLCNSPAIDTTGAPYWRGVPIARSLAITEDGTGGITGGFVLDGWGGVHPFGHAHLTTAPVAYWRGWDIARSISVDGHGNGDVLDGLGGLHPFTYTVS